MVSPMRPMPLRVRAERADGADVVEDVFRANRLLPDPRLGEGYVLCHSRVQVMAGHGHVEVLVERIDRERVRWVCRRRQNVRLGADTDDVGRVAAACALDVVGMDGAPCNGLEALFEETELVEGVGVKLDLRMASVGSLKGTVDGCGRRAPVFVDLETRRACRELFEQWRGDVGRRLAEEAKIQRKGFGLPEASARD